MSVEIRDPRFREVVGEQVAFEKIATGFLFTEGPLWHSREQYLLFSDMPGDHLRRWSERDGVTTFRKPCNQSNGLAWDPQGRLIACEHSSSSLTRTEPDGAITTLASHWQGRELNSPNDVAVDRRGAIYFSDPTYGRSEFYGRPRPTELDFRGVYRVMPDLGGGTPHSLSLLADDFGQPNGLCFSADAKRLFVNDTERAHIRVFDLNADGSVGGGDVWAETVGEGQGAPDGMKSDMQGNVYCCGPGGIHVFTAQAECLGVIRVPEYTANFAWGDADGCSLYITASTSVYRIRTRVAGRLQMT
ncbi:MAG: SMP-30/gluconolactonase/LRE family protein [Lautropia sp.]|nr:SMP-30/gluconolactonase/LRE family protein [Lautropia sp.]